MTDRYPYRHHGPAVHGSKLTDYLISEANMTEDIEQLRAENARLREALSELIEAVERDNWSNTQTGFTLHVARAAISADLAPVEAAWQPIETAPHETPVLLYCPDRGCPSNRERIELGCYSTGERVGHTSTISYHSWATHWMPLPKPPAGENGND